MNRYRLAVGLALGFLFGIQHAIPLHLSGRDRAVAGVLVSVGFLLALAEFATLTLGRRLPRRAGGPGVEVDRVSVASLYGLATLLLVLNLASKSLAGLLAVPWRSPPRALAIGVALAWLAWVGRAWWRRDRSPRSCLLAIAGLVAATRLLSLRSLPFDQLPGDMLATIARSLDALRAGRFPYVNFPPPMPYPPVMFLSYAPPRWLGLDLRWTNLICEMGTALVAIGAFSGSLRKTPDPQPGVWQVALPLFMLHPTWVSLGTHTQFAPCLLVTVVLARSIVAGGPKAQAFAMGLAAGSNQMLAACGPILFGHWLGRLGGRRALLLAMLAGVVVLAIAAPFLAWESGAFLRMTLLSQRAFTPDEMAGRFTIRPLMDALMPGAASILSALIVLAGFVASFRARRPEAVVAAMALGLCGVLLLRPTSFAHYYLPVLALIAAAPRRWANEDTRIGSPASSPPESGGVSIRP